MKKIKLFSLFAAIIACMTFPSLSRAEMTITWDASVLSGAEIDYDDPYEPTSFSCDGITLTANKGYTMTSSSSMSFYGQADSSDPEYGVEFTFSCATANITHIAITSENSLSQYDIIASGWSITSSGYVAEWTGSASSVNFGKYASSVTQIEFTTDEVLAPDVLPGVFSVSPTKTVHFSKGNLQYKASNNSWRFANKQYAVIGNNPGNTTSPYDNRSTQSAWIDLFGWGTGDNPSKAESSSSYYSTYTEWGEQFDTENGWFTLSYDEWSYLLGGRYDGYYTFGVSFAKGTVNGVGGLILLPDDWNTSYYALTSTNSTNASYSSNEITLSDWTTSLEAHGAVFLPATGYRNYSCYVNGSDYGNYWTSTAYSSESYSLIFGSDDLRFYDHSNRYDGYAVRLVSAGPKLPSASISIMPAAINGLEYNGSYQTLITAGTAEGGELQYSTDNNYWSTYLPEGRYAGEYTVYYKVVGDAAHEDYIPAQNQLHISIAGDSDWDGNLSTTTSNKRAKNGTVIYGTLAANVKISILSGATVTLRDATINGVNSWGLEWAGITCEGDATIILEGDNSIRGFKSSAGITVPVGSTLTIDGTGTLVANGGENGAGIGSGYTSYYRDCGHIIINGGIITAGGDNGAAGIGTGYADGTCGNITINGGVITATGNGGGAGIGTGYGDCTCGNITINGGIITATGSSSAAGIGTGFSNCTCGDINITGGVINATGGDDAAGIGTGFSNCVCGNITISGGDITAVGNDDGAGIGTGQSSTCGDITITCGKIVATRGNSYAEPIGEGFVSTCGTVSVESYLTDDHGTSTRTISADYATLSSAPTAITGLVYDGSAQTLINAGTAGFGTMSYSIDNMHWSASLPAATNAGDYTVYYKVVGDATHNDYTPSPNTIDVHIDKIASILNTAPTAISGLEYTGSAQTLITAGSATGGELQYKLNDGAYSTALPQATDEGNYTVYYKVVGDANHSDIVEASIAVSIAAPSAVVLTANEDPNHAGDFYATFFDSSKKYTLPNDGTEAYAAEVSGSTMYLHLIAENDDVLPANTAVIFKAPSNTITLTQSDDAPVTVTATNNLHGVDEETAVGSIPEAGNTIYVLSGEDGVVGFYKYVGATLGAHKAYIALDAQGAAKAPRRLVFHTDEEQGIEDVQNAVQSTKLIENGQLVIIRNGVEYNAAGQRIK